MRVRPTFGIDYYSLVELAKTNDVNPGELTSVLMCPTYVAEGLLAGDIWLTSEGVLVDGDPANDGSEDAGVVPAP